jgi:hypothetical protein
MFKEKYKLAPFSRKSVHDDFHLGENILTEIFFSLVGIFYRFLLEVKLHCNNTMNEIISSI